MIIMNTRQPARTEWYVRAGKLVGQALYLIVKTVTDIKLYPRNWLIAFSFDFHLKKKDIMI